MTRPEDKSEETTVGNYFVANYPPFSFWSQDHVPAARDLLAAPPADPEAPFGLYVHIPFCRKRCDFCYFRVYTDNDSARVHRYIDALLTELAGYAQQPFLAGRKPRFVYFGGGTPSYLSVDQLEKLFSGLQQHFAWDEVEELTFECEPGTLQEKKIHALKDLGVTRLSLGVENFDPEILELNNRAHRAKEIERAYGIARDAGFDQINIDLIAGMVGETEANWQDCIQKARAMEPESITIYQMEVPYNTTIYRRMKDGEKEIAPVADWQTKRRWVSEAFDGLAEDGYLVGSAYTAKKNEDVRFVYRDALWHGADLLGIGVASFGHLGGIHMQNEHDLNPYLERVEKGELPIFRAYPMQGEEHMVRQFVLQLKIGRLHTRWFQDEFGVDVRERFRETLAAYHTAGFLTFEGDDIVLTREGLLQVDRLLPEFFLDAHRAARYA